MRYDPHEAPDGPAWLELDEMEQIQVIEAYHKRNHISLPNTVAHAAFHAVVESQIAMGESAVIETMDRLRREGLDRHDAVHAIGSVLAANMFDLLNQESESSPEEVNSRYAAELRQLTAANWRAQVDLS